MSSTCTTAVPALYTKVSYPVNKNVMELTTTDSVGFMNKVMEQVCSTNCMEEGDLAADLGKGRGAG